jgi:ABC-type molybdate transport system substrate-binding protein
MKLDISLVPYGKISYLIPSLLKYLQESESWTKGRASVDDIIRFVLTGQMQLWVVFDPENSAAVHGYVMTEIKQYPKTSMFIIQYCAMDPNHMKYVDDIMHTTADKFARDMGCSGIEFYGRPGWEPHVKKHGYTVKTVVYEKHFGEVKS